MTCLAVSRFVALRLTAPRGSAKKVASGGGVEAVGGVMITTILVLADFSTDIFGRIS